MLAIGRGMSHYVEVPDAPTGGSPVPRGAAAASTSQSADVGGSVQFAGASLSTPIFSSAPLLPQSGAATQLVSVSSVVTELQGPTFSLHGADLPSSGGGEIGRGGESLAPLSLAWSSDDGWFVVPSAANEYGEAYAAANDGFSWDVAAGEFTVDFFVV